MFTLQYFVPAPSPLIVLISEAIKISSVSFSRKNLLRGFVACFPYTMTNPTFVEHAYLPSKLEGNFLTQLWLLGTPVAQVWYLVQTRSISLLCQCRVISNNCSRPSHNQKLLNENYILIDNRYETHTSLSSEACWSSKTWTVVYIQPHLQLSTASNSISDVLISVVLYQSRGLNNSSWKILMN